MKKLYWNVNPVEVIEQNESFKDIKSNTQLEENITILCQEYEKNSNKIHSLIRTINGRNFEKTMTKIFDREAYLAEIYFYLSEDILINMKNEDVLEIIRTDYLLSYYWKIEELNQTENIEFLLKKWIEDNCEK